MGYLLNEGTFSRLDETLLQKTASFTCGNEDLDEFFHRDCILYERELFGKTYCFYQSRDITNIICAFTVSNASIFTNYLPNARKKKIGKEIPHAKQDLIYPAVLIGRLGININYQHLHIGTELLDFIKSWFTEPSNKTGCRYLIVDAYNSSIPISFYKKNGFEFVFSTDKQERIYRNIQTDEPLRTRLMFFDLIRII